jgi:release factor glutamine methyltransferase
VVARRARREPVSRIVGRREFWSLDFMLSPATLDPRPDSECLIEAALAAAPEDAATLVLDLGTGSGCLLLAFLSERKRATGLGVDLSADAVATARENAARLGLAERARFAVGDWGAGVTGGFDLILCNPPYIPAGDIEGLAPEVAHHDPRLALAGGEDGLEAYRELAPELARLLRPRGRAVLEVGHGQADAVGRLMAAAGLSTHARRADLGGIERCLTLAPDRSGA